MSAPQAGRSAARSGALKLYRALVAARARIAHLEKGRILWMRLVTSAAQLTGIYKQERDAALAALAAAEAREQTASLTYHRQQSAQREMEALYQQAVERAQQAEAHVARLREALDSYGAHKMTCSGIGGGCTCGWWDTYAAEFRKE